MTPHTIGPSLSGLVRKPFRVGTVFLIAMANESNESIKNVCDTLYFTRKAMLQHSNSINVCGMLNVCIEATTFAIKLYLTYAKTVHRRFCNVNCHVYAATRQIILGVTIARKVLP